MSADGRYVAFVSDARNLSPLATDGNYNVYLYDNQTEQPSSLVSVDTAGTSDGDNSSGFYNANVGPIAISADGTYVAFTSVADNLVANFVQGGSASKNNVYVRDIQTGVTVLASPSIFGANEGVQTDFGAGIEGLEMSPDGDYVAFQSNARDLVSGSGSATLFIRDLVHQQSLAIAPGDGNVTSGQIAEAAFSANDQEFVFTSAATNLVPGITTSGFNVFAYNLTTHTISLVSIDQAGTGGGNAASGANVDSAISPDGEFVVFTSSATNLVSTPTNGNLNASLSATWYTTPPRWSAIDQAGTAGGNGNSLSPVIVAAQRRIRRLPELCRQPDRKRRHWGGERIRPRPGPRRGPAWSASTKAARQATPSPASRQARWRSAPTAARWPSTAWLPTSPRIRPPASPMSSSAI